MSSVVIDDVRKSYGGVEVMHGVSVDIPDGSFVVLVGPSGCGKSTLLRMIAGLEEISGGTISIGDEVVNDVVAKDRDIAMVFQSYALYPHMTIFDNMDFSLKLRGLSKAERKERIDKAAGILGLRELLDRKPSALSGGQRQRVAMGRAIVREPKVFLFDEPLSNLDAKLRVEMRSEIKALQHRLDTTTIYVTHDQIEAMTMGDRIVVMRDGRVEQCDTPLNLYDRPANLFVAEFIGSPSMNFVPGRFRHEGAERWLETEDGLHLPLPPDAAGEEGRRVVYGFRPEHLVLGDGLPATIELVEPTGAETMVLLKLGVAEVTGVFRERIVEPEGATLEVWPDPARVHLFDPDTGMRLA
ncbi:ABC transporter ATP-binding protein [Pararhizobium mangrovi]|uniref:sn-glycerol-3-phosphate ABC transporter ATP-binding protein UgpC n=1 Tax=Pararhizobium mangrovi TaxID=2590452 RepID=A0A506U564_9HYPH|nr:sn-glycerol-3-phosphate ABC transporter ATP-binding protein UgpC [Pararhizobium mangrovi]TPW28105.1 sn-glycerol-3-phosphate ABC transporter ATP-binding protein UgpC [Pararhizobium mangrovi]